MVQALYVFVRGEDYSAVGNVGYGIYKDTLYINFDDAKTDGDLLCNEDRVRKAAHALNCLQLQGGRNRIISYAIFYFIKDYKNSLYFAVKNAILNTSKISKYSDYTEVFLHGF